MDNEPYVSDSIKAHEIGAFRGCASVVLYVIIALMFAMLLLKKWDWI